MADSTNIENKVEDKQTQPNIENKVEDAEVLAIDDDENTNTNIKTESTTTNAIKPIQAKPDITKDDNIKQENTKQDNKEENKEENKDENKDENKEQIAEVEDIDELTDLSSSDEEDELIQNTQDWDITFKLSQFLDNHFILQLLKHLKRQKNLLQNKKNNTDKIDNTNINNNPTDEPQNDMEDNKDDNKESISTNKKSVDISLVSEKLILLYNDEEINKYESELLSKTCLIDEQLELFDNVLSDTINKNKSKQSLSSYKERILLKLSELETLCGPLIDFLGEEKFVNDLVRERSFNLDSIIVKAKSIQMDLSALNNDTFDIDYLFAYCRLRYEIGYYQHTDILLGYYRMLTPDLAKKNAALWGQLSAQILQNKWDDAFKAIRDIRERIEDSSRTLNLNKTDGMDEEQDEDEWTKRAREILEEKNDNTLEDIKEEPEEEDKEDIKEENNNKDPTSRNKQQSLQIASIMRDRAWLLHWSLFVFFNKDSLLDELIALFLNNKYMNVIQTMCPHLLRYLTSAVLISPNIDKQSKLKYLTDVSKIIIEEQYTYRDPITEFVRLVIRTNDFVGASKMFGYAMDVIKCDFFLSYYQDYFIQYARTTFLIKFCKLYNRISVSYISKLLLMDTMGYDEIQLWLISAIRSENINAKLDVVENVIYVHFDATNPYQEMKDRTKSMQQRTRVLYQDINHKLARLKEVMENN